MQTKKSVLPAKEKHLFYYRLDRDLNNSLSIIDFTLYFNFWICTINPSRNISVTAAEVL